MFDRRKFLFGSGALVSLAPLVPSMLCRAARAAGAETDARVLVVIQLDGGNDGLNTVVPYADDGYARARNKLRLPANQVHKLNDRVGLHPRMGAAKQLFDDGRLTIVQGVGYPNPDRSHFRSMRIWQTARFDDDQHDAYGWLGRAMDSRVTGGSADAQAYYVGDEQTPVALWGRRSTAVGLSKIEDLTLAAMPALASVESATPGTESLRDFVTRQVVSSYESAARFNAQEATGKRDESPYPPTALGQRLSLVARLLKSGSAARVYYTAQGGYDTHAAQLYTHASLLAEFAGAVKAFCDDLKAAGLDDRVVVMAFSEFGRRVDENDSQGTDHGAAGPVFIAGSPVAGGLIGDAPDLTTLHRGDLSAQFDFRQVYATLLQQWLGLDASATLDGKFEGLPIFGAST